MDWISGLILWDSGLATGRIFIKISIVKPSIIVEGFFMHDVHFFLSRKTYNLLLLNFKICKIFLKMLKQWKCYSHQYNISKWHNV
ncbi:hypothetical protein BH11BAC3_BH11BAC3_47730 [soil metagenome]